jgi:hypothetical protein
MADAMIPEATGSVAAPAPAETGKPPGGEAPSRPKLYDQLSEPGKKSFDASRFGKLERLDDLVAEVRRLDGEVGNGIRVPGKDATKEQWAAYRKAMQIPDAPEGYSLTKPQLPNGLPYNDRLEKWFRQELFDAGVPDGMAQKMFNDWNALQTATFTANQKAIEDQRIAFAKQATEELQAEFKDAFPAAMQSMSAALARFGGTKALDIIKQARLPNGVTLDNHPDFIRMFVEVGRRMDADTMIAGDTGTVRAEQSRPGLPINPRTGQPMTQFYPGMEKDPKYRVKAE